MFWVLQDNLYSESSFGSLLVQLEGQGVPHTIVSVDGKTGSLSPEVTPEGPVFACGGKSLARISAQRGWAPGYIDENLDYGICIAAYGSEMLNHDALVLPLREVTQRWPKFFIRPVNDSKQFNGQVMEWDNFVYWRDHVAARQVVDSGKMTLDSVVVVSSLKRITAEYRFFVVKGRVVTGSIYKLGQVVLYSDRIDEHIREYAQARADQWQPNQAFSLDIADTPDGPRVLELNSINSAGFYACDMGKFVEAVNSLAA